MSQSFTRDPIPIIIVTSQDQVELAPIRYFTELTRAVVVADREVALRLLRTAANQARSYQLLVIDGRAAAHNFSGLATDARQISGVETLKIVMLQDELTTRSTREPGIDFVVFEPWRPERVEQILRQVGVSGDSYTRPMTETSPPRDKRDVLLVEDDVVNRRVATTMLELLGLRVGTASNGVEAVTAAETNSWDLILMDCLMPVMDGLEAAQQIRALSPSHGDVPIIAMSANPAEMEAAERASSGISGCLSKPFTVDQLAGAIQRWLPDIQLRGTADEQQQTEPAGLADDVIDDEVLSRLSDRLPADRMARLVGTFLTESPKLMDRMTAAIEQKDVEELRLASHSLKGSSSFLGATEVTELARQIEGRSGQPDACMPVVQDTVAAFLRAQRALQRRYPTALTN